MTVRVERLTSDVVMFSVVAFKILDISQGSVATHLRCGGIYSDSIFTFPDSDSRNYVPTFYQNRKSFIENIFKKCIGLFFSGHTVYCDDILWC